MASTTSHDAVSPGERTLLRQANAATPYIAACVSLSAPAKVCTGTFVTLMELTVNIPAVHMSAAMSHGLDVVLTNWQRCLASRGGGSVGLAARTMDSWAAPVIAPQAIVVLKHGGAKSKALRLARGAGPVEGTVRSDQYPLETHCLDCD